MQNEYAIKTPAYGGYGGVTRSGYLTANTIENSLPPNIIRHCAFASITRIGQLDVPNQQFSSNWLRVSRTGQICPYTFDKLGLFMSFAAV